MFDVGEGGADAAAIGGGVLDGRLVGADGSALSLYARLVLANVLGRALQGGLGEGEGGFGPVDGGLVAPSPSSLACLVEVGLGAADGVLVVVEVGLVVWEVGFGAGEVVAAVGRERCVDALEVVAVGVAGVAEGVDAEGEGVVGPHGAEGYVGRVVGEGVVDLGHSLNPPGVLVVPWEEDLLADAASQAPMPRNKREKPSVSPSDLPERLQPLGNLRAKALLQQAFGDLDQTSSVLERLAEAIRILDETTPADTDNEAARGGTTVATRTRPNQNTGGAARSR